MTADPDTLAAVADALEAAFPDAGPVRPLRALGEGFRSLALLTPAGVVFRVGRVPEAADGYRREARLLPVLAGRLPAAVPAPRWHAEPSPALPHGALGHLALPGGPLRPETLPRIDSGRLAADLAAFLAALHAVPRPALEAAGGAEAEPFAARIARLRDDVLPVLRSRLAEAEHAAVARWLDAAPADRRMREFTPVPRHGDLWHEHLLVGARGSLLGVVDFEELALGDPAEDFAPLLYLGRGFVERVLAAYRLRAGDGDEGLRHRVARLWEAREFDGVQYAARHADAAELDDALRKLRAGPLLSPRAVRLD